MNLSEKLLKIENVRRDCRAGCAPLPVEVQPGHAAAVVAQHHTVRVEHRRHLESRRGLGLGGGWCIGLGLSVDDASG